MSDNTVAIDSIIYGSFVRKTKLESLTLNAFSNTSIASATELNIFIDLYSVLKTIFSEHHRTRINNYTDITSCIINMCSHYRSFFKSLSVRTKFFIVFSFNTCDINRKFVAEYNSDFLRKSQIPLFNKLAMDNFDLLNILCPYLPDIFFIKSIRNYESAVIIANLIETLNDGNPNLIISKDLYPLQLCSLYPYTSYLYPIKKRINGQSIDDSIMISISEKPSFRYEFWNLVGLVRKFDPAKLYDLSPINFPLFSAINKFPERNILSSTNVISARNIIYDMVGSNNIKIVPEQLYHNDFINNNLAPALIESKLKALDVQFMLPFYKSDPESSAINLDNLQDDATVNMINSKFFQNNPLDLSKL